MTSFSLSPYNWYVLLAAFILLIIFGIVTIRKAMPLVRQLKGMEPALSEMKTGISNAKIKADVVTSKTGSDLKKSAKLITASLTFGWAYSLYKENGQKGHKEFRKSEKDVKHYRGWQLNEISDKINEIAASLQNMFHE